ncbi:hypothetical protein DY000_02029223 [Brassica cretica]|uniref:DUF4005 domain-containing protein n=1 Tax=Brassica cretica TaxID=69181 RepID=A0ABQ7DIP2_BRACR|nr:hypothetical protein DY000_02029223 [Brassica cretica]
MSNLYSHKASVRKDSPRHILQDKATFVNGRKASIVTTRNLAETGKKPPVSPLIHPGSPILLPNPASSKKFLPRFQISNNLVPTDLLIARARIAYQKISSKAREGERSPPKDLRKGSRDALSPKPFQERLDRHGNSFGARVATKQTRIPPPPKDLVLRSEKEGTWRRSSASREPEPYSYASPPYTKQRGSRTGREHHNRGPFPQRELKEWRAKPSNVATSASQEAGPDNNNHQNSRTDLSQQDHQIGTKRPQTEEEILQDLNEATHLYLSCPDPTEAAARRQRVMIGNAKGHVEETMTAVLLLPIVDLQQVEDNPPPGEARATTAQIKSIIISPSSNSVEAPQHHQNQTNPEAPEDVSINEGQDKVKKRTIRNNKARSPLQGPSILRGASSKKRKLSQLRNSPGGGKNSR